MKKNIRKMMTMLFVLSQFTPAYSIVYGEELMTTPNVESIQQEEAFEEASILEEPITEEAFEEAPILEEPIEEVSILEEPMTEAENEVMSKENMNDNGSEAEKENKDNPMAIDKFLLNGILGSININFVNEPITIGYDPDGDYGKSYRWTDPDTGILVDNNIVDLTDRPEKLYLGIKIESESKNYPDDWDNGRINVLIQKTKSIVTIDDVDYPTEVVENPKTVKVNRVDDGFAGGGGSYRWELKGPDGSVIQSGENDQPNIEGLEDGEYTITVTAKELYPDEYPLPGFVEDTSTGKFIIRSKGNVITNHYTNGESNPFDKSSEPGYVGDAYTTSVSTLIPVGYELDESNLPTNATGKFEKGDIIVNYYYKKIETDITAKYVDEEGNEVSGSINHSGKYGDSYTTEQLAIEGYEFVEMHKDSLDPEGTHGLKDGEVIYVYKKIETTITAKYVDEEGNEVSGSINHSGKYGDPYTTEQLAIEGYEFVEMGTGSLDTTGTHELEDGEVIYVYKKIETTITAKYVDEEGNEVSGSINHSGKYGDSYTTEQLAIEGYEFVEMHKDSLDPEGTHGLKDGEVIYVYKKIETTITAKYVDEEGNEVSGSINHSGKYGAPYTTEQLAIKGYEFVKMGKGSAAANGNFLAEDQTVIYVYKKKQTVVNIHHIDSNGNVLAPPTTIKGEFDDKYQSAPVQIHGYTVTTVPTNANGNHAVDPTNVTYVYSLIPPTVNDSEEGASHVTGTGVPGFQVKVTFPNGETVLVDVDPEGKWIASVPSNYSLKEGDIIIAVTIDPKFGTKSTVSVEAEGIVISRIIPTKPSSPNKSITTGVKYKTLLPQTGEGRLGIAFSLLGFILISLGSVMIFNKRSSLHR